MKNKINYLLLSSLFLVLLSACDNYLDITPVGQVIPNKTSEYRGLINSAYQLVPQHKAMLNMRGSQFSPEDDPWGMGLDGFDVYKDIYMWNDVATDNAKTQEYPYMSFYQVIFHTNEIINNASKAEDDGSESLEQVIGEAYALRAYMYFELANMYAPVYNKTTATTVKAIPLTTEIDVEQTFPKATLQAVYDLVLNDIDQAQSLMELEQQEGDNKYRFSLESVYALKSRVLLYMQEWQLAANAAQEALAINKQLEDMNSESYTSNTNYQSKEAMLSLEYVTVLVLRDYASISNSLVALYKEGDLRPSKYFEESWYGYLIANKATSASERVSFRRAELYLNAAEALAHVGKLAEARTQLGTLLQNRYTPNAYSAEMDYLNTLSADDLIEAILAEREKELALEGQQWYDWRRTTQPQVSKTVKGVDVVLQKNDSRYTIQIPKSAREANPELNL